MVKNTPCYISKALGEFLRTFKPFFFISAFSFPRQISKAFSFQLFYWYIMQFLNTDLAHWPLSKNFYSFLDISPQKIILRQFKKILDLDNAFLILYRNDAYFYPFSL